MPGSVRLNNLRSHPPRVSRDPQRGYPHRLNPQNLAMVLLAVFTLGTGVASFLLGMFVRDQPPASPSLVLATTVTGIASLAVGLYAQMISHTRAQRMLIVTGMIGGFVGAALGLAHGGFS